MSPALFPLWRCQTPFDAAKVMPEAPGTKAAQSASNPSSHTRQGLAQRHQQVKASMLAWCSNTLTWDFPLHKHSNTTTALLAGKSDEKPLTSGGWLHTCDRRGTMRLMPTWAASSLRPTVTRRPGGAVACARLGSCTGGRRRSAIAPEARAAPTMFAELYAHALTWSTNTQRWQPSGTGGPGKGHQKP